MRARSSDIKSAAAFAGTLLYGYMVFRITIMIIRDDLKLFENIVDLVGLLLAAVFMVTLVGAVSDGWD